MSAPTKRAKIMQNGDSHKDDEDKSGLEKEELDEENPPMENEEASEESKTGPPLS
jgi:hypothetical protein